MGIQPGKDHGVDSSGRIDPASNSPSAPELLAARVRSETKKWPAPKKERAIWWVAEFSR